MMYLLDLFGIAVFAISGALTAGRKRMDLFGVLVVAVVAAVGGRMLRDLLLDRPCSGSPTPPTSSPSW